MAGPRSASLLEFEPWTRWLTWVFQVMPIFFLVGGYSNGVSWKSATRSGKTYGEWLRSRLQRLVGPVLPLLLLWAIAGAIAGRLGVESEMIRVGSQVALVPIWFLAVYVMVVVLVPATYAAWQRFGLASFAVLALLAVADDALFFAAGVRSIGWLNYAFIWVAVHQLGYAWRDGYFEGPRKALAWALAGAVLLAGMVAFGPYPVSMVSVPGEAVSNTLPPKLPMLAIGDRADRTAALDRIAVPALAPPRDAMDLDRAGERHDHDGVPVALDRLVARDRPGPPRGRRGTDALARERRSGGRRGRYGC